MLLLLGVIMPGVDGRELYRTLSGARPEMKVLYMSGYDNELIGRHGVIEAGVAFVQNPFSMEALARKVREVLDA